MNNNSKQKSFSSFITFIVFLFLIKQIRTLKIFYISLLLSLSPLLFCLSLPSLSPFSLSVSRYHSYSFFSLTLFLLSLYIYIYMSLCVSSSFSISSLSPLSHSLTSILHHIFFISPTFFLLFLFDSSIFCILLPFLSHFPPFYLPHLIKYSNCANEALHNI